MGSVVNEGGSVRMVELCSECQQGSDTASDPTYCLTFSIDIYIVNN